MEAAFVWPVKTRDMHNHHMNSTVWDSFKFRSDDIIIATYGKAGTTWMQQIMGQLIFNGDPDVETAQLSPWIEMRILPPEIHAAVAAQTHRRFVKTHLPVDALVFSPRAKYLYVGRDGRDSVWSLYNHHRNMTQQFIDAFNLTPGLVGKPLPPCPPNEHDLYRMWFEDDGQPFWPFWENVRSWWNVRHLANVMLVHFNDMKRDLAGNIRAIAAFLDIDIDEARFADIVKHCSFDFMKANAAKMTPLGGVPWHGGAGTFINKGTNGRWRNTLSPEEITAYETRALAELGPECARWLAHGSAAQP